MRSLGLVLAFAVGCSPATQNRTPRDPTEVVGGSLALGVGGAIAVAGGSILFACGTGNLGCNWQSNKSADRSLSFVLSAGGAMAFVVGAAALIALPVWIAISRGEKVR